MVQIVSTWFATAAVHVSRAAVARAPGHRGEGAARVPGMRRSLDQFQSRNTRKQKNPAIVDRYVRGKPDMPMKKDTPLHWNR